MWVQYKGISLIELERLSGYVMLRDSVSLRCSVYMGIMNFSKIVKYMLLSAIKLGQSYTLFW